MPTIMVQEIKKVSYDFKKTVTHNYFFKTRN